jgi:hypothetical protein
VGLLIGLIAAALGSATAPEQACACGKPEKAEDRARLQQRPEQAEAPVYTLQYRFEPGQVLRWQVEHQAKIETTISGTTQTADTETESVKVWRVSSLDDDGNATFVYEVEKVDMRQRLTGRREVHYNSENDAETPPGFENVAQSVGVPLAKIKLDPRGQVIDREDFRERPTGSRRGLAAIVLPGEAVPIGHVWYLPDTVQVTLAGGGNKVIKLRQRFTLESVEGNKATIAMATEVLSVLDDASVKAQLIQARVDGYVEFDIERGCVIRQASEVDDSVVGFQGDGSRLAYEMHMTEELLPEVPATASAAD